MRVLWHGWMTTVGRYPSVRFAVDWKLHGATPILRSYSKNLTCFCELSSKERIALYIDHPYPMQKVLLVNRLSPFGLWYLRVVEHFGLSDRVKALDSVLLDAARYSFYYGKGPQPEALKRHVAGWLAMKDLPEELRPPDLEIGTETFHWQLRSNLTLLPPFARRGLEIARNLSCAEDY